MYIKASICGPYRSFINEQKSDMLKACGFSREGSYWHKFYEGIDLVDALPMLSNLLAEINLDINYVSFLVVDSKKANTHINICADYYEPSHVF